MKDLTFPVTETVLHEKGHCGDDSTSVIGVMKVFFFRIFHCCIDDDPPTSEELQQQVPTRLV